MMDIITGRAPPPAPASHERVDLAVAGLEPAELVRGELVGRAALDVLAEVVRVAGADQHKGLERLRRDVPDESRASQRMGQG